MALPPAYGALVGSLIVAHHVVGRGVLYPSLLSVLLCPFLSPLPGHRPGSRSLPLAGRCHGAAVVSPRRWAVD